MQHHAEQRPAGSSCHTQTVHEASSADLHAKEVFAGVAAQQRPLRRVPLDQVGRHRHLAAGHIHAQPFADAPAPQTGGLLPVLSLLKDTVLGERMASLTIGIVPSKCQRLLANRLSNAYYSSRPISGNVT